MDPGGPGRMGPLGGLLGVASGTAAAGAEPDRGPARAGADHPAGPPRRGPGAVRAGRRRWRPCARPPTAPSTRARPRSRVRRSVRSSPRRRCCGRGSGARSLAILTPEQQAEAAKIQAERELRMKQFRRRATRAGPPAPQTASRDGQRQARAALEPLACAARRLGLARGPLVALPDHPPDQPATVTAAAAIAARNSATVSTRMRWTPKRTSTRNGSPASRAASGCSHDRMLPRSTSRLGALW